MNFRQFKFEKEQALFSRTWYISDESGEVVFVILHPGAFSSGPVEIVDRQQNVIIEITKDFWSSTYQIHQNGAAIATVSKVFSLKNEFRVEAVGGNEITILGNFWSNEYRFLRDETEEFAFVSRKTQIFSNDQFGVAIVEGYNHLLILAIVTIITMVIRQQQGG